MSKEKFEFHRRLPLQKITEDLPYRLAGIKKEKKIISDSSESSDDINTEFDNKDYLGYNRRDIKKEYTFRKKKKKLENKIQRPKTSFLNRDRLNITLYFNNSTNNLKQNNENKSRSKTNYGKYKIEPDENISKEEISYSNFDASKSNGCKNIYPFLTEFDYESEENKRQREHFESIHISGTALVPSSCKDLQVPSEFKSNFRDKKSMELFPKKDSEEEINREIENWQTFSNNESYNANEENSTDKPSDSIKDANEENSSKISTDISDKSTNPAPTSDNSEEAAKFKELLKHSKPKPIKIDSNLQEKVSNRVTMKKKMTAAVHNSVITSNSHTVLPITWQSAKKSLVVKRHEIKLQDYLENHKSDKLMTHDEIEMLGKSLKKVEKQKTIAKEKQNIPDWAKGASQPILMTAPKKTKIIVRSKYMKEYDFLT